eukprot:7858155-Alexandrium_andersonii.AAC.1
MQSGQSQRPASALWSSDFNWALALQMPQSRVDCGLGGLPRIGSCELASSRPRTPLEARFRGQILNLCEKKAQSTILGRFGDHF